jgi:cytochrome o ubiquinol oxidase operon protein cyoD
MLRTYQTGFLLSMLTTIGAFYLVLLHMQTDHVYPNHEILYVALPALALVQLVVQMICFLHIGRAGAWRWAVLASALALAAIVVGGSLWIMQSVGHGITPVAPYDGTPSPQTEHE